MVDLDGARDGVRQNGGLVRTVAEQSGLRVELDERNEKIGYKIREAQLEKVPYMLIVGDKEVEAGNVSVRSRSDGDKGVSTLEDFLCAIKVEIDSKAQ